MLRVMLLVNNPQEYFPKEIKRNINGSFIERRTGDIITTIENLSRENLIYLEDFSVNLFERNKLYTIQAICDSYFTLNPYNYQICNYHITYVDTTKPWTIIRNSSNTGMESVLYLDNLNDYILINDEFNYYERR